MKLTTLLVVLAGCGDNLPDPDQPHSGSRLKLEWWVYEDGARHRDPDWYRDTQLDVDCTPATFSDVNRYCEPDSYEAVYINDTCTQALGQVPAGMTPSTYFTTRFYFTEDSNAFPSRVFHAGKPSLEPAGFWAKVGNRCVGPNDPGGYDYYELAEEVPQSELVRLHRDVRGDGPLAVIDDTSADGLRAPQLFFDRDAGQDCATVDVPRATSVACAPKDNGLISYFTDDACAVPALDSQEPPPSTARTEDATTGCATYYRVGSLVWPPATMVYEQLGGRCQLTGLPAYALYSMAGPYAPPIVERQRAETTHRMQAIERVSSDGRARMPDPLLYDSLLDIECRTDGAGTCVPEMSGSVMTFFADASCSTPIRLALMPTGTCRDPDPHYARVGNFIYPLLGKYTGTIHELSTGDTCGVYPLTGSFTPYETGEAVDRSTFAHARLEIDP